MIPTPPAASLPELLWSLPSRLEVQSSDKSRARDTKHDIFAVVSSWLDRGSVVPVEWKTEMDALKSLSSAELQQSPDLRFQLQAATHRLRYMTVILYEIAAAMSMEYHTFEPVNGRCGLALLPDEILSSIFNLLIDDDHPRCDSYTLLKWRTAIRLSHVSQRFRNIMLESPRLWTHMNTNREMVASCIPRTRGLPLSVGFKLHPGPYEGGYNYENILTDLLPHAKRWACLNIWVSYSPWGQTFPSDDSYWSIYQKLCHLDAPLLEELHVYNNCSNKVDGDHWNWTKWNTPKLRHIKAHRHFPLRLPGLAYVTSLNITLQLDDEKLSNTLKEISRMSELTNLTLCLENGKVGMGLVAQERLEFPTVQRLKIETSLHFPDKFHAPAVKTARFSSLYFPNAVHLGLKVDGFDYSHRNKDWRDQNPCDYLFNNEIGRIFRDVDQYPRVETFHFEVHSPLYEHFKLTDRTKLAFPLDMLPSLKHFTLKSNTLPDVTVEELIEDDFPAHDVVPRTVGDRLPALETISLDVPDPSVVAGWVGEYLGNLKERGDWDRFRELAVMEFQRDSSWSNVQFHQMSSYLGDKALEWCEDTLKRAASRSTKLEEKNID